MAEYDAAGGDKAYLWRLHRILAMYVLGCWVSWC